MLSRERIAELRLEAKRTKDSGGRAIIADDDIIEAFAMADGFARVLEADDEICNADVFGLRIATICGDYRAADAKRKGDG